MIKGLEHLSYKEKLSFDLFSQKRRLWEHLTAFQFFKGACEKEWEKFSTQGDSDSTRGSGIKLKVECFRLDIRKKLLTQGVVRH